MHKIFLKSRGGDGNKRVMKKCGSERSEEGDEQGKEDEEKVKK